MVARKRTWKCGKGCRVQFICYLCSRYSYVGLEKSVGGNAGHRLTGLT